MASVPLFWVDAFATHVGRGNPAGVVPLLNGATLSDASMQLIAFENKLAETAFLTRTGPARWSLRWFTPEVEVDLCGHATLAAAHVVLRELPVQCGDARDAVTFDTRSGELRVSALKGGLLQMDFPARPPREMRPDEISAALWSGLRLPATAARYVGRARDILIELGSVAEVEAVSPDFSALEAVDALCVIVAARGPGGASGPDVVSRVFCPACGVPEDPVTGSAHCTIAPYFALPGSTLVRARQASARGGDILCELVAGGERVLLSGTAVLYMRGEIALRAFPE